MIEDGFVCSFICKRCRRTSRYGERVNCWVGGFKNMSAVIYFQVQGPCNVFVTLRLACRLSAKLTDFKRKRQTINLFYDFEKYSIKHSLNLTTKSCIFKNYSTSNVCKKLSANISRHFKCAHEINKIPRCCLQKLWHSCEPLMLWNVFLSEFPLRTFSGLKRAFLKFYPRYLVIFAPLWGNCKEFAFIMGHCFYESHF